MKLQERICICGCGRRFRVLPSSPQKWFSTKECPENFKTRKQESKLDRYKRKKAWGFRGF